MAGEEKSALVMMVTTAVLWGTSFPVATIGLRAGAGPLLFVFLRFSLAAPMMVVAAVMWKKSVLDLLKDWRVWALGATNMVGYVLQLVGQDNAEASIAALLVNFSVVIAAVGGAAFLRESFGRVKAVGVVIGVFGAGLVATDGSLGGVGGSHAFGEALFLMAAVSWGGYILYAKKVTDAGAEPVALASCVVLITALLTAPLAFLEGFQGIGWSAAGAVIYAALFNTAVPFMLYQKALRHLPAGTSAVVLMLEIVVALGVSSVLLAEPLTTLKLAGAAGVMISALLVSGAELRGKDLSVGDEGAVRGPR